MVDGWNKGETIVLKANRTTEGADLGGSNHYA
jgi:hypothetical protein